MTTFTRTTKARGGIGRMLVAVGALALALPTLAAANDVRDDEPEPGDDSLANRVEISAPDEELVGTLPIFFDPDTGMPVPGAPDDPAADPGDEPDDPAPPGGGGLVGPTLPPVLGAPKLFLYGPYHLLALHRDAIDPQGSGRFSHDESNLGYSYLVLDNSTTISLPVDLFTFHGVETGLLIGGDEIDPVIGCVSYLGQLSLPLLFDSATKKDFPVAALEEYGFLLDSVSLLTRSSLNGRCYVAAKSNGLGQVHITFQRL